MGLLEAEEKEKLYQEHCDGLMEKKRLQFRRLLEETSQVEQPTGSFSRKFFCKRGERAPG